MKMHKSENLKCPSCGYVYPDATEDFVIMIDGNPAVNVVSTEECEACYEPIDICIGADGMADVVVGEMQEDVE